MSHVLTATPANANFVTDKTVPDNSESGTIWWNLIIATIQQSSDREVWLKGWHADAPVIDVPLVTTYNASSRFTVDAQSIWTQSNVTDTGGLSFSVGRLPHGRKITSITARIRNNSSVALPSTKPELLLYAIDYSTSALLPAATVDVFDTASLATYQTLHDLTATPNHTIDTKYKYIIFFAGETGTNSTPGLILTRITLTLGY